MVLVCTYRRKSCSKCTKSTKVYLTCFKCGSIYHAKCLLKVLGFQVNQKGQAICCGNIISKDQPAKGTSTSQEKLVAVKREEEYDPDEDLESYLSGQNSGGNKLKCVGCLVEFTNRRHLEIHYRECLYIQGKLIPEINRDEDLKSYLPGEKDSVTNKFKRDPCTSELAVENLLENHYPKCPNKQREKELNRKLNDDEDLEHCLLGAESLEQREFSCDARSSELANREHQENHYKECPEKQRELVQQLIKDKAGLICSFCKEENFQKESYEQHIKWCEKYYSRLNTVVSKKISKTHILAEHSNPEKRYKCSCCKYSSYIKTSLVKHMHTHTNERPFKCDMCDYTATWKSNLKSHILVKHSNSEKRYKCNDCKYSAHEKTNLVAHVRIHTNERPFECDMCDYTAARKSSLESHILVKHSNVEKRYKCKDCKYSTHQKGKLVQHMYIHTKERPFKCDICDYASPQKSTLESHVLVKHSNSEKRYKCNDCKYSTHQKRKLAQHTYTHTNKRPFKCDMCDYAAARKSTLESHVLVKHSTPEKMYKCSDCKYSACKKSMLVLHMRTHTSEKLFKCDMCDYSGIWKSNLKSHILVKHSNSEKRYKCNDCKYSAHERKRLVVHMRIHSNEKPFKCNMCDYTAIQKKTLKSHILAKHSNLEKTYKCNDCKYSTYCKNKLVRHMRIHTNERPFKCESCNYATCDGGNLKKHILIKHSNEEKR